MKIKKEVKAGIVVVVAIALFVWGFNFLKGRDIFSSSLDLYARYQRVDGLVSSNPVQFNGFKIGIVRDIKFDIKDKTWIVHFTITNDEIPITAGSKMEIFSDGLLGSKAVRLVLDDKSSVPVKDGDFLLGDVEQGLKDQVNAQVKPLKDKAESLISSIDSVMTIVQTVLNKDARGNLTESFQSIKDALATFRVTSLRLDSLVKNEKSKLSDIFTKIQTITTTLSNSSSDIGQVLANVKDITDSIAKANVGKTIAETNAALVQANAIITKINNGEGTVGMLVNDSSLYKNLNSATQSLHDLTEEIQKYPGKYIPFKRKSKAPKTPAADRRKQDDLYKEIQREKIKQQQKDHQNSQLHKDNG